LSSNFNHFKNNLHPKDLQISFNNDDHEYFVNKKKISFSVSEIINNFFPKFDAEHWSKIKAVEQLQEISEPYDDEIIKNTQNEILDSWDSKRKEASKNGLIIHETIEKFYNQEKIDLIPHEFNYFQQFISKYPKLKPYRTEWRIYNDELTLAGTVDMVYKKENGDFFLFDWKRSTRIVNDAGVLMLSDFKYAYDELSHIADNSFNKYALQQNLYKYILENYYDKKISSMNLLVLHPRYHTYFHLQVPEMKKETEFLVRQSIEKSQKKF
tara:strand:- start:1621 stop:2424 length:804 start_codon:yes stop_codon:yes gene_type:complete